MKPNGSFNQQQPMQWYSGGMDYSQGMHYQQPMAPSHHHYSSGFDDEPPLLEGECRLWQSSCGWLCLLGCRSACGSTHLHGVVSRQGSCVHQQPRPQQARGAWHAHSTASNSNGSSTQGSSRSYSSCSSSPNLVSYPHPAPRPSSPHKHHPTRAGHRPVGHLAPFPGHPTPPAACPCVDRAGHGWRPAVPGRIGRGAPAGEEGCVRGGGVV